MLARYEVIGVPLPEVKPGDDLAYMILKSISELGVSLDDGDIIVVTSKVLMKARGYMLKLDDIKPSKASILISKLTGKDPKEVELILKASSEIITVVRVRDGMGRILCKLSQNPNDALKLIDRIPSILVVLTKQGLIALDGGVDYSNLPSGYAIANIPDFDREAKLLRDEIMRYSGKKVAVVVTDTEANATGKVGTIDVAVGIAGLKPITPYFASKDRFGRPKFGGVDIIADEIASAAALIMGQASEGIPVVLIKGLKYIEADEEIKDYTLKINKIPISTILKTFIIRLIFKLLYRSKNQSK